MLSPCHYVQAVARHFGRYGMMKRYVPDEKRELSVRWDVGERELGRGEREEGGGRA